VTCPELNLTCSRRDELPAAQFVGLGFLSFVVHSFFWCHVSPQFDSAMSTVLPDSSAADGCLGLEG